MGLRVRKGCLVTAVHCYRKAGALTAAEAEKFEEMFRKCRSSEEQDQVRKALHHVMESWKKDTDCWSLIRRDDFDFFGEET